MRLRNIQHLSEPPVPRYLAVDRMMKTLVFFFFSRENLENLSVEWL